MKIISKKPLPLMRGLPTIPILILFLLIYLAPQVQAATINVSCNSADLINAINTANSNGEADTLVLNPGCTYTLTAPNNNSFGPTGLPAVTTAITIEGNGAIIRRDGSGSNFRLFYVSPSGLLSLRNLTLSSGRTVGGNGGYGAGAGGGGAGMGGAIFNEGTSELINTTLIDNEAIGGKGGDAAATGIAVVSGGGGGGMGSDGDAAGSFDNGRNGGGFDRNGNSSGGNGGATNLGGMGNPGGNGGDGGGGGGGGTSFDGPIGSPGGSGGFGGGGGAGGGGTGGGFGGSGGFGGGGGGGSYVGVPLSNGGAAGFGGGAGGNTAGFNGGGGGGAGFGGAIFNSGGTLTVINSTFSGNMGRGGNGGSGSVAGQNLQGSGIGGAIFNRNGTVAINNATLVNNTANQGGGIFTLGDGSTAELILRNSIIANTPNGASDCETATINSGALNISGNDNLVESHQNCPGVVTTNDPNLGPLANNGGNTATHALTVGSPAVNRGNAGAPGSSSQACAVTDQRGVTRPQSVQCDIGAYELQLPNLSIGKSVSPNTGVIYRGEVTYTLILTNSGGSEVRNVLLTDTLPVSTTFSRWVNQPAGANVTANQLTWLGTVGAGQSVSLVFVVNHTGDYGDTITNTVQYSDTIGTGSAEAAFTVETAPLPMLSIDDVGVIEGNTGSKTASFTVTLSQPVNTPVTVAYTSADGSATITNADYIAATGVLTFTPGSIVQQVPVSITGDTAVETDETFLINLNGATGAMIADTQGLGTIINDDVEVSISDATLIEENEGTVEAIFEVQLSASMPQTLTVAFATADGTATLIDHDYLAASGVLTFAPYYTSQTVVVTVNSDKTIEPDETFYVNLSNLSSTEAMEGQNVESSSTIIDSQGVGTILNDDLSPAPANDNTDKDGDKDNKPSPPAVPIPLPTPVSVEALPPVQYLPETGILNSPNSFPWSTVVVLGVGVPGGVFAILGLYKRISRLKDK